MIKTYDVPDAPALVEVYSIFGQLAHSRIINDPSKIILDLSFLDSGIYILRISDGNKNSYVRIIKN